MFCTSSGRVITGFVPKGASHFDAAFHWQAAVQAACFYMPCCFLAVRKQIHIFFHLHAFHPLIFRQLASNILFDCLCVFAHRIRIISFPCPLSVVRRHFPSMLRCKHHVVLEISMQNVHCGSLYFFVSNYLPLILYHMQPSTLCSFIIGGSSCILHILKFFYSPQFNPRYLPKYLPLKPQ